MFESSFLPVIVGAFTLIYSIAVIILLQRHRIVSDIMSSFLGRSPASRHERFYQRILNAFNNGFIEDIDDLVNMYTDHTGIYHDRDNLKFYLVRRLRGFLSYLTRQKDIDEEMKKKILGYKSQVKQWVSDMEKKEPYSDVPSSERHILLEIERLLPTEKETAISGRLKDLSGLIRNRQEERNRLLRTTRWSVPMTVVGVLLTLLFGGINLYQFYSKSSQKQQDINMFHEDESNEKAGKVIGQGEFEGFRKEKQNLDKLVKENLGDGKIDD